MREFLEIMLCMFSAYGFYRFLHAIKALCSRRIRVVLALRADKSTNIENFEITFGKAASLALNQDNAESEPAVLCEDEKTAQALKNKGCSVYMRY